MSLGIVIKGPEGVVLAADTRLTLGTVTFDNASKILPLGQNAAAVTYGVGSIGGRSAHSLVPQFLKEMHERHSEDDNDLFLNMLGEGPTLPVSLWTSELGEFFKRHWESAGSPPEAQSMSFLVAGITEGMPYGETFRLPYIGGGATQAYGGLFGMAWGGQSDLASRIINGYDGNLTAHIAAQLPEVDTSAILQTYAQKYQLPVPYPVLPLQDCIDLAMFLIRATINLQGLAQTVRGVGGTIEVVTITPEEGLQWVQKREIRGELRT